MKKLFLLAFALCALVACKQDQFPDAANSLKFDRVDLSGAEYLTVLRGDAKGKSAEGNRGLFKIDKDGNMTAVACSFSYSTDENGNKVSQEVRTDVKVVPSQIYRLGNGEYLNFRYCVFLDAQGEQIYADNLSQNYLIRTQDGAVFDMRQGGIDFAFDFDKYSAQVDANGNIYCIASSFGESYGGSQGYKMASQGDKMVVSQLTNSQLGAFNSLVLTDKPNTLIAGEGGGSSSKSFFSGSAYNGALFNKWYVIYANGGFEPIARTQDQYLFHVGNKVKILERNWNAYMLSIRSLDIQPTPPYKLTNPTHDNVVVSYSRIDLVEVVECTSHYVLDCQQTLLVCSYADDAITEVIENFTHFNGENGVSMLGNIRFTIDFGTQKIKKFDFETLTYSEITYDAAQIGGFMPTQKPIFSVADKTYTVYGVRHSDGRSIVATINIETGFVKVNVNAENRTITELIKLN